MKYWLLSSILSVWAASSSIFLNAALAFQLPLVEYGEWVRWTSLLPLLSGFLAPLVLYCSRVESSSYQSVDIVTSFLADLAAATVVLVVLFALIGSMADLGLSVIAGGLIWLSNLSRVCIDGILLSPQIIRLGLAEKIARIVIPTISLIALILINPRHFVSAGFCISMGIIIAVLLILSWLKRKNKRKRFNFATISNLYIKELPSAYLSFVSTGVFSVPLYLYAKYNSHTSAGIMGVVIVIVTGSSAFSSMFLSRPICDAAEFFHKNESLSGVKLYPFIATSIFSSLGSFILVAIFFAYKEVNAPYIYALVTSFLVFIELTQSFITIIFIRLGYRNIILSATGSAIANISLSILISNPIYLILGFAVSQFLFFLIPGTIRLNKN